MGKFLLGGLTFAILLVIAIGLFPDVFFPAPPSQDMYVDENGGVWLPVTTAAGQKMVFVFKDGESFKFVGTEPDVGFAGVIKVNERGICIESFKNGNGPMPVENPNLKPDSESEDLQVAMN